MDVMDDLDVAADVATASSPARRCRTMLGLTTVAGALGLAPRRARIASEFGVPSGTWTTFVGRPFELLPPACLARSGDVGSRRDDDPD
jgi:hypothetical protein